MYAIRSYYGEFPVQAAMFSEGIVVFHKKEKDRSSGDEHQRGNQDDLGIQCNNPGRLYKRAFLVNARHQPGQNLPRFPRGLIEHDEILRNNFV